MKILAIADRPDWAYDTIAKQLRANLPQYDWEIKFANAIEYINLNHKNWDLILSLGWKWPKREIRTPKHKTISVLLSHRTFDGKSLQRWGEYINERYCVIGACNLRLLKLLYPHIEKITYTPCGVDAKQFTPDYQVREGKMVAGWAGRGDDPTFRGLDIMKEACTATGWELRLQIASEKKLPHKEMVNFYRGLDVYLNMSISEGGSCSVLEAAACGVPCITTDVGVARETITDGQTGYIIGRSTKSLTEALQALTRKDTIEMGKRMRSLIEQEWTWGHHADKWDSLIQFGLEQAGRK